MSRLLLFIWACLGPVFVWASVPVSAAVASAESKVVAPRGVPGAAASPSFDFVALGQVLIGLMFVLGLFLVLAWLVRRAGFGAGFSEHGLKVIATLPLSTRERLVLVQAGSQQLLLGVAPGRVNLLERFDQPLVDLAIKSEAKPPFSQWLQRALHKQSAAEDRDA